MRRLGQKHHLELDEHAQMALPACDEMPLTWHVTHGLHRVSTKSPAPIAPGPIEMYEPPKASRIEVTTALIVTGILAGLVLVAVAGPLIENLPELMGATAK